MRRIGMVLAAIAGLTLFAGAALAEVKITNEDSKSYDLRIATSDSCFSGTDTSIGGNSTSTFSAGWLCIERKTPAFKIEDGKHYVIKGGKVSPK